VDSLASFTAPYSMLLLLLLGVAVLAVGGVVLVGDDDDDDDDDEEDASRSNRASARKYRAWARAKEFTSVGSSSLVRADIAEVRSVSFFDGDVACSASAMEAEATSKLIGYSSPVTTSNTADAVVTSSTPKYIFSFISPLLSSTTIMFGPLPHWDRHPELSMDTIVLPLELSSDVDVDDDDDDGDDDAGRRSRNVSNNASPPPCLVQSLL